MESHPLKTENGRLAALKRRKRDEELSKSSIQARAINSNQ